MSDEWKMHTLGEFIISRRSTLDPRKYPDEVFELYSVPSHANGTPELAKGNTIGSTKYLVSEGEVLLSKINPRLNRTWVVSPQGEHRMIGSSEWIQFPSNPLFLPNYLAFFLSQQSFVDFCKLNASGVGGSLTRIKPSTIADYPFPIPSINTQNAIVSKLTSSVTMSNLLESKLDGLKDDLSSFNSSLLKSACEGKLVITEAELAKQEGREYETAEHSIGMVPELKKPNKYSKRSQSIIPGVGAISVGDTSVELPEGWARVPILDVARMESGHTPSRKHPEYWDGDIPWMSLSDARTAHGGTIIDTKDRTNALGIANSAARLLPCDTVCLSRTASVGYVVKLGAQMATSQDFVNWICSDALLPDWLRLCLLAEGQHIRKFGSGTTHTTIYYPEVLSFHIALPPVAEQRRIVDRTNSLLDSLNSIQLNMKNVDTLTRAFRHSLLSHSFQPMEESA